MTPARAPLGITVPFELPLGDHPAAVRELAASGYTDLWSAETARYDAFSPLLALSPAAAEHGLRLGTAIASVYARGPGLLAMSGAALADTAPGRALLGVGASSAVMAERWHDRPQVRPVRRVSDTVTFLRKALAGERVTESFETFSVNAFRLERPPPAVPPILVAALRPRMLEVAAEVGDGVVLNWLGAADVATVRARLDGAIDRRPFEMVARVFVCPSDDADTVRRAARTFVARYLSTPGYAAYQRWLGHGPSLEGFWQLWEAGDRAGAARAIPDEVVDGLVVHGTPEECRKGIERYRAAGVGTPVVKILPLVDRMDPIAAAVAVGRAGATAS